APHVGPLDPLPSARLEAALVANRMATEALVGPAATRSSVMERVGARDVVHIASHGWFDDRNPLGSSIALADGLNLTAANLQQSPFEARLAVLSACDVGRGQPSGGEFLGFGRSLLVAGARSVVMGMWQAADTATLFLIDSFYERWRGGQPAVAVLNEA